MIQEQLSTPVSLDGPVNNAPVGAPVGKQERIAHALDNALPLVDASNADVVEYRVETPMRYAECMAIMPDGRKIGLLKPRQFVGWSSHAPNKSLLFQSGDQHVEVIVEERLKGHAPGAIREVLLESAAERCSSFAGRFIGRDGDLVRLPQMAEA